MPKSNNPAKLVSSIYNTSPTLALLRLENDAGYRQSLPMCTENRSQAPRTPEVLRAVLRRITPSIVVLESQPVVPPPFRFARHYSADYACGVGLHGCSLSYQVHLLFPEYLLLLYTEHDTIFVHRSVAGELEALPPGLAFPWTGHLVQLPADEFDCFRRARSTPHPQGGSREVSVRFLREWALALHPLEAFALVAGNLTIKPAATGGDAPLYSIDV